MHSQRGAATIAVAIILLILITLAVFTVSGSIVRETKVINSGVRSQQAFEAAEAGLAAAADYFGKDWDRNDDGIIDDVYDTDADDIGDSTEADVGAGRVVVTTDDISTGIFKTILVKSQGFSDDSTATRTITQVVAKPDPLPSLPDNPLTARTNVDITGSATIVNPEGNTNIWTGGDVDLGQNNSTSTAIADPQDINYPDCMETPLSCSLTRSSDKDSEGQDLVQSDSNLFNSTEDELFEYYFGLPKDIYREYIVTLETTAADANTEAQYATEEVIWIDGDVRLENVTTIGCGVTLTTGDPCPPEELKPSILIIDGNAEFRGPDIFGLVYVTGNITVTSSTDIQGAVVVGGSLNNSTSGSLDLLFNSDVLNDARRNGGMLPLAGTWKDFNEG
jgi:hypothetical protein